MGLQAKTVPDSGLKTKATLMKEGAELKTALAAGKMRLFKNTISPTQSTTAAELAAAEADYDGYVALGVAVAAANDPYLDSNGSVLVTLPLVQFNFVSEEPTVNVNEIKGAWYEDAAGVPRGIVEFDSLQPMESNDNSIAVVMAFRLGTVPPAA